MARPNALQYECALLQDAKDESYIDSVTWCVCKAFCVPLPDEELERLRQNHDMHSRRAAMYQSLAKHLGAAATKGRKLFEFGSIPTVLECDKASELFPILKPLVAVSLQQGIAIARMLSLSYLTPVCSTCANAETSCIFSLVGSGLLPVAKVASDGSIAATLVCQQWDIKQAARYEPEKEDSAIMAMLHSMQLKLATHFPKGATDPKVLYCMLAAVSPEHKGHGLLHKVGQVVLQHAEAQGFTHAFAECTGPISQHVFMQLGFQPMLEFSVPYWQFSYRGEKPYAPLVFESPAPGGDSHCVLMFKTFPKL